MADYKIHLGVKLNTSDINTQISKYKASPINIKADLDTSGITKAINSYKSKPIIVDSMLNTDGITEKIRRYVPPKKIHLESELSTVGIDKKINSYTPKKPIIIDVELNKSNINQQIASAKPTQSIKINAELNKGAISEAIRNYKSTTPIKVMVDPDFSRLDTLVKNYIPRNLLKVNAKLNKSVIDNQIKEFKTNSKIEVGAKLKDSAIETAIRTYAGKELVPITVDFKVGETKEITNKINEYKNKSVVIPVKLQPAQTGFDSAITKKPVRVQATLDPDGIDNAIDTFKPTKRIKVGVQLDAKDVNGQVAKLPKPTDPIDVEARLNRESINKAITSFKPSSRFKVGVDLQTEDINQQIEAIHPTSEIKVNVNLDNSDINTEIGRQNTKAPAVVNVKLDRDKLNEQIRNFKTQTKLKVGIKLDFVGIAKQINDYKTKSKIKVGIQLDRDDIAQEIATVKTDTPIKLGVELDPEGVQKIKGQVKNIKRQIEALGNVRINLDSSATSATTGSDSGASATSAGAVKTNVAQGIVEADIKITNMEKHVDELSGSLKKMGFEKSAIDGITKELEAMDIVVNRVVTRLDKNKNMMLTIMGTDKANRRNVTLTKGVDVEGQPVQFTKVSQKIGETERFLKQQRKAAADLTNQINQMNRAATDSNARKPIQDTAHLDSLKSKYNEIILAIEAMGNASSDTFEDERIKVKALISEYKSLKSEYKNAENVSIKYDGNSYSTGLEEARQDLIAFKREASNFPQIAQTVKELDDAFEKVGDAGSLQDFTRQLGVAESALRNIKTEANEAYRMLADAQSKIDSLSTQAARLNPEANPQQLAELSAQLEEAEADYKSLKNTLSSKLSTSQFGTLQANADDLTQKLEVIEAKHRDTRAELAKKINIHLEAGKFTTQVQKVHSEAGRLVDVSQELEAKLQALKNAKDTMDAAFASDSVDEQIASYRQYSRILEDVTNQLKQEKIQQQDVVDAQKLKLSKQGLSSDMTSWLRDNSAAAKKFGDEVKRLQAQLNACDNGVDFNNIRQEFRNVQKEAKALGLTGLTTLDKIKNKFKEYGAYFSVAQVFMYAFQGMRDMFEQVKLIDSAMTELKKVTDETDASYNKFLSNAGKRSKEIGTTIDGLVSSTADFARLGYGFEDAQGLAEVANIYAVVGDEIEGVEGATESLISTMAAFKDEMNGMSDSDFAMSIIDKFNEIGNNFAISSGGIGEALERSASSLMAANNTLDESIALITAANTVVQNPDAVGTAFKTISMRIRGAKTELEEAGLETEGMVESTATLRAEIEALSGVDIMEADGKTFKSTYAILDELAQKWEDLSDIQQATVTELIAGKRQGNIISSLMTNFDTAREALETSLNSSGSAMKEHEKWQQSLEARINTLKASWQEFAQTFMDSDTLKVGIDALSGLVNILEKLIDNVGLLGTIGLGVAGKGIFSYFKGAKEAKATLNDVVNAIRETSNASKEASEANVAADQAEAVASEQAANAEMNEKAATDANIRSEQQEASVNLENAAADNAEADASRKSADAERAENAENEKAIALEKAEAKANRDGAAAEVQEGAASAKSAADEKIENAENANAIINENLEADANLNSANTEVAEGAKKSASAFGAFASSLSGWLAIAGVVITVTSTIINLIKKHKEAEAERRQEVIQSSDEFLESANSFEKAYIKYAGKTDLTVEEEKELESAINGTVDALNDKSSKLQGVVNSSNDYIASLERITDAELKAAAAAAENKKNKAGLELQSVTKDALGVTTVVNALVGTDSNTTSDVNNTITSIAKNMDSEFLEVGGNKYARTYSFKLSPNASVDEVLDYYDTLVEFQRQLDEAAKTQPDILQSNAYTQVSKAIEKMSGAVETYTSTLYQAAKAQYQLKEGIPKTVDEYVKMREAILRNSDVQKMDMNTRLGILNDLDSQYKSVFDLTSVKVQARKLVGIIGKYGDGTVDGTNDIGTIETFLNMRTLVNNNECTVGEYMAQFDAIDDITKEYTDEEKQLLNTTFGIDTDSIKEQYDEMEQYLTSKINIDTSKVDTRAEKEELETSLAIYEEGISNFLNSLTANELAAVIDLRTEIDWENTSAKDIRKQIENQVKLNEAMNFTIAIDVETEGIEALNTALAESKSATGLTAESIKTLQARYKDLDGYNAATLFEETANGIRINSTELAKLEKEYKDFDKQEADKNLKVLKKEYDKLTNEINNCTDDQKKLNDLYKKRDAILEQINDVATLAAQYEGLTSAYNEWQKAQEAGQDRDMYESILEGREEIEDEMSRGWLDDATVEYLELLTGKELSTAGIDAQIAAYKELDDTIGNSGHSIWDFFTEDEDGNATSEGVFNFFDTVKSVAGETAAWVDENGAYHFDFEGFEYNGKTGDAAIADILGTSEELVQIILRAAEDAGFVVNIKGEYTDLANMSDDIKDLNDQLKSVGATDYTFNVKATDLDYVNEQIDEAKSALQFFENRDGKINLDDSDVRAAANILATLVYRKSDLENPTLMSIDVSEPTTKLEEVLGLAQQLKDAKANLEIQTAIGADTTEAEAEIDSLLSQLSSEGYADIVAGLSIDTTSVDSAIASINAISSEKMISLGLDTSKIDGYVADDKEATVTYNKDSTEVDEYDPPDFTRTVTFNVNSYNVDIYDPSNLTRTVTYKVKTEGEVSEANGTANVNGTAFADGTIGGRAYKHGDWGIKGSGVALGGELGTEILVRDGKWYTVGDNGAEFFRYRQGDIIFNHRQTEELFANGRVTSGGGRGKALAEGTAFALGSKATSLVGRDVISEVAKVVAANVSKEIKSDTKSETKSETESETKIEPNKSGSNNVAANNSVTTPSGTNGVGGTQNQIADAVKENTKDKFEETFDWIAIAIERFERVIDNLDKTVNDASKSWVQRNQASTDEINAVRNLITDIGSKDESDSLAGKYWDKAHTIFDEDSDIAKKIRGEVESGTFNIDLYKDENGEADLEKIKEYQKWYELYLDIIDKAADLKRTEAELWAQRFDDVISEYEGILQGFEHTETMLNEYISQAEAKGHIVSGNYYQALIDNNNQNVIPTLTDQRSEMVDKRNDYVAAMQAQGMSLEDIYNSEQYKSMSADIDGVTQNIEAATTQTIEWQNAIRDIDWQVFDLMQERISDVAEEANFLIDLMSYDKLFDDNGKLTDKGMATMGLHGQNINTYMYAADEYANEIAKIDKQIADGELDGNSKDVIDRRRTLVELQRESILAAEDEKQAIKDLVEEGINLELEALQERIDLHNEELDSMKDLYDYQKNVEEQTKNIASLQKQLHAYEGFDDEETRATVQKLKVELESAQQDLQETEYDKYIADQTALLDELFLEYENVLNTRLDDVDGLISQVVDGINIAFGAEGTITSALGAEGDIAKALAANATSIGSTLKTEAEAVGTKLSTSMDNIWKTDGSGKAVLDLYGKDFQGKHTATNEALNKIKADVGAMVDDVDKNADKKIGSNNTQSSAEDNPPKDNTGNKNIVVNTYASKRAIDGDALMGIASAIWCLKDKGGWGDDPFRENKLSNKIGKANAEKVQEYVNKYGDNGKLYDFYVRKKYNLNNYKYSAFASGAKNIDETQLAWTQERGREFIIRPSDGAILTPIAKKDSVLNAQASENLWNMTNSPAEFIKDNLNLGATNVPNNSNTQSSYTQILDKVVFNLPNVKNYEELLSALQKDPKFDKLIKAMTIDQIAGKSSLTKNKSIR